MLKKKFSRKKPEPKTETEPEMAIPSYFGGFGPPARFRQRKKPQDAMTYDYRLARTNLTNPNSIIASVVHMLMFAVGSGSVAVHGGYMACGIWTSLGVNIILSCAVSYCVCLKVLSMFILVTDDGYPMEPWLMPPLKNQCLECADRSGNIQMLIVQPGVSLKDALVAEVCFLGVCVGQTTTPVEILVWSAQKLYGRIQHPQLSYQDVAEATFLLSKWPWMRKCARPFRYLVEMTLIMHCYTSCCVFVIMIGRNLKELVEGTEALSDEGDPPLKVYILSLMVPCAVVCMVTNLKYLAPFALIAVIYSFAVLVITVWYAFQNAKGNPWDRPGFKSANGLFELIGICIFVSETASMALSIENNMDRPKKFHYVVCTAMPIVTFVMMTIGFFGYWHYGELCFTPILVHFPFSPFPIQLKVFLCLLLYVIIAMTFYAGFDIEWFYIKRLHQQANYWFWERLYRGLHVAVIDLIAFAVPNVTRTMGIVGSFWTNPVVFIYPPLIELILDWEYPGLGRFKWRLIKCIFMIIFGLSLMIPGTYFNIYGLHLEMKYSRDTLIKQGNLTESGSDGDFYDIISVGGDY